MNRIICEFKSDTGSDGYITGYSSTFGNIGSYKDIVAPGYFTTRSPYPRSSRLIASASSCVSNTVTN
jgi:hypothetical protein